MLSKLTALLTLSFIAVTEAAAQQAQTAPAAPPNAPYYYGPGPWHMWGHGYGWHFGWFFPLFMFLLMILVCVALARLLFGRRHFGGMPGHMMYRRWGDGGDPSRSALQILNERFARGEIQKSEYEEKKAAILSG